MGFTVLDALAKTSNLVFTDGRYGATATSPLKGIANYPAETDLLT
ncbi:MAG: hypothetical protein ACLUVG_10185 [Phocaeicola vulgatus]